MEDMETFDLVVVGAGWHGLAMAKTYLDICPEVRMLIVDPAQSVGGTWAKERLYPGLKTNNIIGSYEFGDFPMTPEAFGVKPGSHIPGAVVHEYLRRFAERFDLLSRTRLRTKVKSAKLGDDGHWLVQLQANECGIMNTSQIMAKKLVIATGLTSEPSVPVFPGQESFTGNFLHSRQLTERAQDIRESKEVVVIGANKSAWDACYSAATSGAHVTMVIRPGGGGPSWVWPVLLPFGLTLQKMANVRFFTLFDPCIWAEETSGFSWLRRFLHRTWSGRQIVRMFWRLLAALVVSTNGYSTDGELAKLRPWSDMYWMGNSLGVHNFDTNWFDLVKQGKINVQIAEVTRLSGNKVALSNGHLVLADTLICCTGWKAQPPLKFLPEGIETQLGLPGQDREEDEKLLVQVRHDILAAAPGLKHGPSKHLPQDAAPVITTRTSRQQAPYRLYRFMVPPSEQILRHRNLAFIGAILALNATTVCQTQALWISAFFQGHIPHLKPLVIDVEAVQYQALLQTEFCRIRHPPDGAGAGERCPDLVFDGFLYTDLLLRDLQIDNFRKKNAWQELFGRYWPSDYAGTTAQIAARVQSSVAKS